MKPFATLSRRDFALRSAVALAGARAVTAAQAVAHPGAPRTPLTVVCVGAHPDDPESGCGGTLARYALAGHKVTVVYLTRGEAGIPGKSHAEAAEIRTEEAKKACAILGATPVFAGQIDGATEVNTQRAQAFAALLLRERPDVVLTHWPIDTHPDHQAASFLTMRAHRAAGGHFSLFFFEVDLGSQTMGFMPTTYVDISLVRPKKQAALFAHRSQNGEEIYRKHHEVMENFRGRESGVSAAEAFVSLPRNHQQSGLPGLPDRALIG
jgi:LmbE family N-acetylglucosaminyl deacetylase